VAVKLLTEELYARTQGIRMSIKLKKLSELGQSKVLLDRLR
jgi:hypothetical protein